MDISSAKYRGELDINRDYLGMLEDSGCDCFSIADGSLSSAEVANAAEIFTDSVMSDFKKTSGVTRKTIAEYFKNADELLWARSNDGSGNEYKCSAAVLLTDGNFIIGGHLGNCRIYYLSENYLQYITPDHSLAYLAHSKGKYRFPAIRKSADMRTLTAYLGADPRCEAEITEPMNVHKGDAVLICTDGFWEKVTERQVERTLKHSKSSSEWLRKMLKIIKRGDPTDDYSAITIIF